MASASSITEWSFTASHSTEAARPRPSLGPRALLRIAALLLWLVLCLVPHLLAKALTGRSPVPPFFLKGAGWLVGVRARAIGEPVRPHSFLLANHLSWLDILVLAGTTGCAFVSKDALGHPLIHWLADQNHTVYVKRDNRRGAGDQARAIAEALKRPQPVTLFPEGAVGPGDRLLPFRSSLLQSAAATGAAVTVRPVALDYGEAATEISWYGQDGRDNFIRILNRGGTLPVTVRLLEPLATADRKQMAQAAHEAIDAALFASSPRSSRL